MSWLSRAKKLFLDMQRPLSAKDLALRMPELSDWMARKTISQLKAAHCIEKVSGPRYQWIEGSDLPEDRRGQNPNSLSALQRRASRPHSQITAMRGPKKTTG